MRNPEAAIENFQNALKVDSKDTKAQVGMAIATSMKNGTDIGTKPEDEDQSVAKVMNNIAVNLARQGQFEKAVKYYMMSFAFVGSKDLQVRVSYNMGLGFKKWDKLPQAKFWLQKSLQLSDGKFTKAANQLIGLEGITPMAGLGGLSKKSRPTYVAPEKIDVKTLDPTPKPAMPAPPPPSAKAAPAPAPAPVEEDLSFLEEETVANSATKTGRGSGISASTSKAFDSMVSEIDGIVEVDGDFQFDDSL